MTWAPYDPGPIPGLIGDVTFGDKNGRFAAALQLQLGPGERFYASDTLIGFTHAIEAADGDGDLEMIVSGGHHVRINYFGGQGSQWVETNSTPEGLHGAEPNGIRIADFDGDGRAETLLRDYSALDLGLVWNSATILWEVSEGGLLTPFQRLYPGAYAKEVTKK